MAPPPYRFTSYDLASSVEVARALKDRPSGGASADELAVFLGYSKAKNGAFLTRLANARLFGLVEGPSSALRPTERALRILLPDYPATAEKARLEAFEDVPLYKAFLDHYHGETLPDEAGMKNALETRWTINADKSSMVLARLMDSAEQAGLFKVAGNRTKMVRPSFSTATATQRTPPLQAVEPADTVPVRQRGTEEAGEPRQRVRANKIIDGVLEMLPDERAWDEASLKNWLDFFEGGLRLYYKLPRPVASPSANGAKLPSPSREGGGDPMT